eukprot:scaffold13561_cov108-Phaeocystis_antarctica.AAC.3
MMDRPHTSEVQHRSPYTIMRRTGVWQPGMLRPRIASGSSTSSTSLMCTSNSRRLARICLRRSSSSTELTYLRCASSSARTQRRSEQLALRSKASPNGTLMSCTLYLAFSSADRALLIYSGFKRPVCVYSDSRTMVLNARGSCRCSRKRTIATSSLAEKTSIIDLAQAVGRPGTASVGAYVGRCACIGFQTARAARALAPRHLPLCNKVLVGAWANSIKRVNPRRTLTRCFRRRHAEY